MNILRLFDVSQYIYSGVGDQVVSCAPTREQGVLRSHVMPCAGLTNILNTYLQFAREGTDLVFCFDSPPTIKREMHERMFPGLGGYKGGRPKKPAAVKVQARFAEDMLHAIGIRCMKVTDYECDDIMASMVEHYRQSYDKIIIHSKDSDMFYLVQDGVEVEPVLKQGRHITRANYDTMVKPNFIVPYNTLTLTKLAQGEPGDNIPYAYKHEMDKIMGTLAKSAYRVCGNNELLRAFIADVTDGDARTLGIFDLIAPLIIDEEKLEIFDDEINEHLLHAFACALGCRGYTNADVRDDIVDAMIERYITEYESLVE